MASTTAVRTLADVRADMQAMQEHLEAARDALAEATEIGERLYVEAFLLSGHEHEPFRSLPRFSFEIAKKIENLLQDMGGDVRETCGDPPGAGDFDLDRLPDDARDLLDLFDFAVKP